MCNNTTCNMYNSTACETLFITYLSYLQSHICIYAFCFYIYTLFPMHLVNPFLLLYFYYFYIIFLYGTYIACYSTLCESCGSSHPKHFIALLTCVNLHMTNKPSWILNLESWIFKTSVAQYNYRISLCVELNFSIEI